VGRRAGSSGRLAKLPYMPSRRSASSWALACRPSTRDEAEGTRCVSGA
jgi:hypothetical protein